MICDDCDTVAYCKKYGCVPKQPTSEHPASKSWVGLTHKEFREVTEGLEDLEDCWIAIEAKLKEKNA